MALSLHVGSWRLSEGKPERPCRVTLRDTIVWNRRHRPKDKIWSILVRHGPQWPYRGPNRGDTHWIDVFSTEKMLCLNLVRCFLAFHGVQMLLESPSIDSTCPISPTLLPHWRFVFQCGDESGLAHLWEGYFLKVPVVSVESLFARLRGGRRSGRIHFPNIFSRFETRRGAAGAKGP